MIEDTISTHINHALHDAIDADTRAYLAKPNKGIDVFNSLGIYKGTIKAYNAEPVLDKDKAMHYAKLEDAKQAEAFAFPLNLKLSREAKKMLEEL